MTSVVSLVTQNWNRNQNQKKNQPHSIVNFQNKKQPRFENHSKKHARFYCNIPVF